MAAPVVATTSSLAAAQRTTVAVPVPSSVAAGDVLVVQMYLNATSAVTPPSGFTEITPAPATSDPSVLRTWWKSATGADTGSYSFTVASAWTEAACLRITGAAASSAVALIGQATTDTTTTTAPAVTGSTTGPDRLLVYGQTAAGSGVPSGTSYTAPGSYSEQYDSGAGWLETATITQATQGSVGSVSGTSAGAGTRNAVLVEVLPPATTGLLNRPVPRAQIIRSNYF